MSHLSWLLLSFVAASAAIAADSEKKAFDLPDKSRLELAIPAGWKEELKANQGSAPATIVLTPREGAPFQVSVTPVARQQAADKAKPSAVEPYLSVDQLTGAPGPGYYFSATDREPKPGEYKYLSQGMLLVGDVVVAFVTLTNDGQETVRDHALAMLKSASHRQ